MWGVWAGIQILRGRNFQYPLLGKLAIRWTSREPFIVKRETPIQPLSKPDNGHIIAGLGHATILAGVSLFLSPILWVMNRPRSQFLSRNLLQASLFQLTMMLLLGFLYFFVWGSVMLMGLIQGFGIISEEFFLRLSELAKIIYFPESFMILFLLLLLTSGVYVVIATVQTFRGKEFNYPIIGKWLLRYISK